jgi:hypothetical protein
LIRRVKLLRFLRTCFQVMQLFTQHSFGAGEKRLEVTSRNQRFANTWRDRDYTANITAVLPTLTTDGLGINEGAFLETLIGIDAKLSRAGQMTK